MGRQIIKQPDGKYAVWSSVVDALVAHDMTRDEVEAYFVDEAKQDAASRVHDVLAKIDAGRPRDAYYQFALTWDEAVRSHNRNFPDERISPCPTTPTDHPSNASGGHEPRQGREEPTDDAR